MPWDRKQARLRVTLAINRQVPWTDDVASHVAHAKRGWYAVIITFPRWPWVKFWVEKS